MLKFLQSMVKDKKPKPIRHSDPNLLRVLVIEREGKPNAIRVLT